MSDSIRDFTLLRNKFVDFTFVTMFCFDDMKNDLETTNFTSHALAVCV